jgi:hypothetical protein
LVAGVGSVALPAPPPAAFGISDAKDTGRAERRLTPHPLSTYTSPLNIKGPVGTTCAHLHHLYKPVLCGA